VHVGTQTPSSYSLLYPSKTDTVYPVLKSSTVCIC